MSTWRPATKDEVDRIVAAECAGLSPELRVLWERIRTRVRPAEIARYGKREIVFVVAEEGNRAIYWEDIESGFNISTLDEQGRLLEHGCDQDGLAIALHKWGQAESEAQRRGADLGDGP